MNIEYRRIYLKCRYYLRKICVFFCICPDCGCRLNYTTSGRAICPDCGKAK
jgi:hypothetical protein